MLPTGRRADRRECGRSGGQHCTAGQYGPVRATPCYTLHTIVRAPGYKHMLTMFQTIFQILSTVRERCHGCHEKFVRIIRLFHDSMPGARNKSITVKCKSIIILLLARLMGQYCFVHWCLSSVASSSSGGICNAADEREGPPPGASAVGRPTLHGGPVRLRPVMATPCFACTRTIEESYEFKQIEPKKRKVNTFFNNF